MIMADYSLNFSLLGPSNPPTSASPVVGTTGMQHHVWLILYLFVESGSCFVAQAGVQWYNQLTATSNSWAQAILPPQTPE